MKKSKTILHYNYFYFLLIILAIIYSYLNLNLKKEININMKDNFYTGIITSQKINGNKLTLEVKSTEKILVLYYFDTEDEMIAYINNYHLGDTIYVEGEFVYPKNNTIPSTFNYKKYLNNKNIYVIMNASNIKKIKNNSKILYSIKNIMISHISKYKSKAYLETFILGNKNYIDNDIITSYQENGISHLLAISGMHVSLLSSYILLILNKLRIKEIYKLLITSSLLFLFMLISGCSSSVSRSVILFFLIQLNKTLKLEIKTINILYLTFCLLLLMNPKTITEIGFQFSFCISFYLILCQEKINNNSYFLNLLKVSFISFFASIPITLYYYYQINILSIIFNIFFVPFISLVVFPLSLLTFIFPIFDSLFLFITTIMENISVILGNNFNSILIFGNISLKFIILYYLFLTLFLVKNKKIFFIFILIMLTFQYYNKSIIQNKLFLMIDVGQGDSSLININNKTILIDTGGKINYYTEKWKKKDYSITLNALIPVLRFYGIRKIDYLILTHGDYDHMGEAINLVNNFKVENVIFNNDDYNELETELIKVLENKKIKYYKGLKELNIESDKLYFLNTKDYDNENDNSNVLYFKINKYKFLFMGDAGIKREKDILDEYNLTGIDFIKIGHHGSNTSSSKYFIDKIKPKNCLISVGKNNRYGHPKESVLDILDDYCNIYRTDINGSIEIKINKNNYKIKTYSP